jgi:hypothetical protein
MKAPTPSHSGAPAPARRMAAALDARLPSPGSDRLIDARH